MRPLKFSAFIGKITRNLSLDKYEYYNAQKRGKGETQVPLEELQEYVTGTGSVEDAIEDMLLTEKLNCLIEGLSVEKRKVFTRRYWYLSSIEDIAADYQISESKVKALLNVKELCAYLGIGQTKARELLSNPANGFTVRIGNRVYVHKGKLDKWLINQLL